MKNKLQVLKNCVVDLIEDCLINLDTDKYTQDEKILILAHGELYQHELAKLAHKYISEYCPAPKPEALMKFRLLQHLTNRFYTHPYKRQTFTEAKKFIEAHGKRKVNGNVVESKYTMWVKKESCVHFHMKDSTVAAVTDNKHFAGVLANFVNS